MEPTQSRLLPFLSLFTSASTLICCALPALFVALGMGAVFAGLVSTFPQLIWMSEHKVALFIGAAVMLSIAGVAQYRARNLPCPIDAKEAQACDRARRASQVIYTLSVVIYLLGATFAFAPLFFS